jgi:hypothetical protein
VFLVDARADVAEDQVPLLAGDSVVVPAPGEAIGMEWWHFQRNDLFMARTWGDLLVDIGWTQRCLLAGPHDGLHRRKGVGYTLDCLNTPAR